MWDPVRGQQGRSAVAQRTAVGQRILAVVLVSIIVLVSIGPAPKDRIKYSELKFQEWPVLSLPSRQRIGADPQGRQKKVQDF